MARNRRDRDKGDDAARATLAPGQLAVPNVRLTRKIAEGGMGSVWEGEHLALHTTVAVKFVLAEYGENDEAVARFEREATAAARIKSPHVVQVLDHGITENEGVPYIVMELLEGEDLEARLQREPRLPLPLVAHLVTQAAKALGRAHSLGIVHRDIKPSNVFLTDVGGETFVKLLDFGIARLNLADVGRARVTQTGAMLGTPIFMSPEQMTHAKDVGPGADIWSLGVVAYLAITGRLPFDEETIAGIAMAIERGEYPTPTEIMPQLPTELDAWFARIFVKDPAKRFGSAKEMADALGKIAELPPPPASVAHPSSPPPPAAPSASKSGSSKPRGASSGEARVAGAKSARGEAASDASSRDDDAQADRTSEPPSSPGQVSLLEPTEDEPTHVEDKGQVAARVAAAAAAAAALAKDGKSDLGDTQAGKKTLRRKTPVADAPRAPEVADDADTPAEDVEITTSSFDTPDEGDGARSAQLPTPVLATAEPEPKGPTTMMGVSGTSQERPERKSRGALYAMVALGLLVIAGLAYVLSSGPKPPPQASQPSAELTSPPAPAPSGSAPATASSTPPEAPTEQASSSPAPSASAASSAKPAASVSAAPKVVAPPKAPPSAAPAAPSSAAAAPATSKPADAAPKPAPAASAAPKAADPAKTAAPAASH
jgi:serine/threonine-protein kinase